MASSQGRSFDGHLKDLSQAPEALPFLALILSGEVKRDATRIFAKTPGTGSQDHSRPPVLPEPPEVRQNSTVILK